MQDLLPLAGTEQVKRLQSQGHAKKKKKAHHCSKFNACSLLSCQDHSTPIFCLCGPTVTLVKVIEMTMSTYAMHRSTIMPSLDAIA